MKSIAVQSIETKNAIIWSINTTARTCGVRMQGSSNTLTARFPPSWSVLPSWVQSGNPVQIHYKSGLRYDLELTGPGQIIPTPTTGNFSPSAAASDLPDGILSGCAISEIPLEPQMGVLIQTGAVRINGSTIDIDAIKMDSTYYKMDMGGKFNDVAAAIQINTAPTEAGNCRYDLFVAGTDGIIDYHVGTTFQSTAATATILSIPADHIRIGTVLIPCDKSKIRNSDINVEWSSAVPNTLLITADTTELSSTQSTAAITVTVKDNFGNNIIKDSGQGWRIELEIINGTGSITSTEGASTSLIGAYLGSSASYDFSYTREGTAIDISPIFITRLVAPLIQNNFSLTLKDSSGDIMTS